MLFANKFYSLLFCLIFIPAFVSSAPATDELKIHFFGVEQADSLLVVFPSGYSVLVDMGVPPKKLKEQQATDYVINRIQEILGHNHVNVMVATHIHKDHVGGPTSGFRHVLEKGKITTDKFIYRDIGVFKGNSDECKSGMYTPESFDWKNSRKPNDFSMKWMCDIAEIKKKKVKVEIAKLCSKTQIRSPNDPEIEVTIVASDAKGTIYAGYDPVPDNDENRYSIGLLFKFRNFTFFTAGDLTSDIEKSVSKRIGEIDLYKANHHGSSGSSSAAILDIIKPQATVILCGDNDYYHPHPACLNRLHGVNSDIYVTSEECSKKTIFSEYPYLSSAKGDVLVSTNGYFFTVGPKEGKGGRLYKCKGAKQPACKT